MRRKENREGMGRGRGMGRERDGTEGKIGKMEEEEGRGRE